MRACRKHSIWTGWTGRTRPVALLRQAQADNPTAVEPVIALGDIYRGKEKYAEAALEYTHAIALAGKPLPSHWSIYYARGHLQ